MATHREPVIEFNRQRMAEDAVLLGLNKVDWARRAKVSDMTVIRFLRGEHQTAKTIGKLCRALNQKPARYLIRKESPSQVNRHVARSAASASTEKRGESPA